MIVAVVVATRRKQGKAHANTGPAEADLEGLPVANHILTGSPSHAEPCVSLAASARHGCPKGSS